MACFRLAGIGGAENRTTGLGGGGGVVGMGWSRVSTAKVTIEPEQERYLLLLKMETESLIKN